MDLGIPLRMSLRQRNCPMAFVLECSELKVSEVKAREHSVLAVKVTATLVMWLRHSGLAPKSSYNEICIEGTAADAARGGDERGAVFVSSPC